mmetsp:Transcript_93499/g.263699  ORF Transcript_93499/g.263699 Transcript_93499/m.263699 type:complete len:871 (-) Transcript_93499:112-2724(-)
MGAACTRPDARGGYGVCSCSRVVDGLCSRPAQREGVQDLRSSVDPAASPSAGRLHSKTVLARNPYHNEKNAAHGPGAHDARAAELVAYEQPRRPAPGLPVDAFFRQGDEVVVKRDLGGGYQLQQGELGKVLHIDGDGDALIAFPDQEEQWVHSSMFPKLAKVVQDVPFVLQLLRVMQAACLSMCGWNILTGAAEVAYWHFIDPKSVESNNWFLTIVCSSIASFLFVDCCGLQVFLARNASGVALLPPLLLALCEVQGATSRLDLLILAASLQGWGVISSLAGPLSSRRRQVDGWGVLLALVGMPMLRWSMGSVNIFLTNSSARIMLGVAGVLCAVAELVQGDLDAEKTSEDDAPRACAAGCCRPTCEWSGWPSAISSGLMGGSAVSLFLAYMSSLEQPGRSAYSNPTYLAALETLGALSVGIFALAAVWCMTPWWLDTCQAALMIGLIPLVGCALQGTAGVELEVWGSVSGSGWQAHCGLLLLTMVFPFMLALFSKELALLAQSRALGRSFFVLGLVLVGSYAANLAVLLGDRAPLGGELMRGRQWLHTLGLGLAWCVGLWAAPNGASRPSVHDLWYLSRHSGPPKREYMLGAVTWLGVLLSVFLMGAVPMRTVRAGVQLPVHQDVLIIAGFNVQQGFDLRGFPNVDCVSRLLTDADADLAGLSESNGAHAVMGSSDPVLAYASRLGMESFLGTPSALPSSGQAILSRVPFRETSASTLEASTACATCSSRAHVWSKATVEWQGVLVQFHVVHIESLEDASSIKYVAEQLREHFRNGPLILVGSFGMPINASRPRDSVLAELVTGTGLKEVFGALDADVELPLAPTEFVSGRHNDYIFYRDLQLVGKYIDSRAQCSDHTLTVASFRVVKE